MGWVADVEYRPDEPEQERRASEEAETACSLLRRAGLNAVALRVPPTPDPAGGWVFGEGGFYRVLVDDDRLEAAEAALRAAGWSSRRANERVRAGKAACICLESGPPVEGEVYLGTDPQGGRYADVFLRTCPRCARRWVHTRIELEAFPCSTRWFAVPISPEQEVGLTAEGAAALFRDAAWHRFGGSYFGHGGGRAEGPARLD